MINTNQWNASMFGNINRCLSTILPFKIDWYGCGYNGFKSFPSVCAFLSLLCVCVNSKRCWWIVYVVFIVIYIFTPSKNYPRSTNGVHVIYSIVTVDKMPATVMSNLLLFLITLPLCMATIPRPRGVAISSMYLKQSICVQLTSSYTSWNLISSFGISGWGKVAFRATFSISAMTHRTAEHRWLLTIPR